MAPALVLILAKVIYLVELALEKFVTISPYYLNCDNPGNLVASGYLPSGFLVANGTCDGFILADVISNLIGSVIALVPGLLMGLSPWVDISATPTEIPWNFISAFI